MTAGDEARVTVTVDATPEEAFRLFTEEIELWWRRGPKYRMAGRYPGTLSFEPGVGGRILEQFETPAGPQVFVMGHVSAWEPPARLVFAWRATNFAPDETTEVEVTFRPSGNRTQVSVQHRGWAKLRADHPVRHGASAAGTLRRMGLWWGELLTSLREHAL